MIVKMTTFSILVKESDTERKSFGGKIIKVPNKCVFEKTLWKGEENYTELEKASVRFKVF